MDIASAKCLFVLEGSALKIGAISKLFQNSWSIVLCTIGGFELKMLPCYSKILETMQLPPSVAVAIIFGVLISIKF